MNGVEQAKLDRLHKNPTVGYKAIYSGSGGILVAMILETAGEIIIWVRVTANRCKRMSFYEPHPEKAFDVDWSRIVDELN